LVLCHQTSKGMIFGSKCIPRKRLEKRKEGREGKGCDTLLLQTDRGHWNWRWLVCLYVVRKHLLLIDRWLCLAYRTHSLRARIVSRPKLHTIHAGMNRTWSLTAGPLVVYSCYVEGRAVAVMDWLFIYRRDLRIGNFRSSRISPSLSNRIESESSDSNSNRISKIRRSPI